MKTNVTFRHFQGQNPDLHSLALESTNKFKKFNDDIITANVEFINEADKTVQFTVHVNGSTLVSSESSTEFKKSIALAEDKMIGQIKKLKTKIADRH